MDITVVLLFLISLIFASAYFSASETALFSLSLAKIKSYQTSSSPRHRLIAKLVLEPRNLLVTVFMLNTLVNILIQNTTSHIFGQEASWTLKVGVPFILMLLLGEIIPKNIGLQNNVQIANLVAPSINFMQNFIAPLRNLIVNITAPISRIMFFYLKNEESISKEEIKHVLKTSEEHGVLLPDEAELVWGYLDLQDATVRGLMRPRNDILYYDINDPLTKLMYLFIDQECSRLPVCDKSLDSVLGILTARQFFLHRNQIKTSKDLIKHLLPPLYIPENTPAKLLIRRFDECNQVIALVVDEYGSISGLITREDIVEQVVGDISDLRDAKSIYTKSGVDEIIASGLLELIEFNEYFNSNLVSKNNMMTIGGWLTELLGEIPKTGTKNEIEGFVFQVLAADPNKIRRLYIRKINPNAAKK
ncbi:MAG TPA: hemolysin family protein [Parachlamydiaceae bacterium]|nr:hemolysin family protein [Parachlamydiaceae bacterium]